MIPACRASDPLKKRWTFLLVFVSSVTVTLRAPAFRCFCASGHLDAFPIDQRIGNLASGFMQVAPCGLAGDSEFLSRLFLFEPFEIDEPYQFDLIGLQ
jgi:hypothetical protein